MTQVGAGLQHAHSNGIIHRDVKPANIMLLANGTVKIMDFGIALLMMPTEARLTPQGSLIGTFPYMAPEQFYGSASDALTDIFAYGATFYKLITGIHPFHAPEMAGVMFNIVNKRPQSVRELNPECPEALEEAIFKALSKDRDSRYQSLDDVLFDLEPIVVELRKEHTLELIAEARQQIAADQFDEAQSLIKQALNIDPANRTLRELREKLQREIKERNLRPRVAALVDQGREQLRARQYNEAIQRFESALRLDNSSGEIHALIAEARSAWETAQRSERLVKEARRAFDAGDFTAAYKCITDALSIAPDDRHASGLLEEITSQIESRNRERRLSEVLSQAKGLILLQNFDESIEMLGSLQLEYPESSELQELLARAVQERDALERAHRLQAEVRAIKDLLKEGKFFEALGRVSALVDEFPDSGELSELGSYAREELRAQKQAEAIAEITAEVRVLVATGQLDSAMERIRSALVEYPMASALREALQSTLSTKAEHERSTALEATAEEVRRLLANTRFSEALDRIASFTQAYGEAVLLDSFRRAAADGLEKQRRISAILNVLTRGRNLIDEGRPSTASEVLEQATIEFPGDPNLTELLSVARNKAHERQQAEAISKLIKEAETFARSGRFQEALDVLETGSLDFPGNNRLVRCREVILAQRAKDERERLRREAVAGVTQLKTQRRLQEAAEAIKRVVRNFGEDQETVALTRSIAEDAAELEREQEMSGALAQAQAHLDEEAPSLAVQVLQQAIARHSDAPHLKALLAVAEAREREQQEAAEDAAERAREQEISVAQAQAHLDEGSPSLAAQVLQDAIAKHPDAPKLKTLLAIAEVREREQQEAAEAAAEQAREQEICIAQAQAHLDGGVPSLAVQTLREAVSKHPEASQLKALLAVAEARQREQQEAAEAAAEQAREQEINAAQAQAHLNEGSPSLAAQVLQDAIAKHPDAPQLKALLAVAEAAAEQAREQEINAAQAQAHLDEGSPSLAAQVLRDAIAKHPDAPQLKALLAVAEAAAEQAREQEISATQAQAHLDEGSPTLAAQLLQDAIAKHPDATQLKALLAVAEARQREQREAKEIDAIVGAAHEYLEREQFEAALKELDQGLEKYSGRKEFEDQRARTLAAKQTHDGRKGLASALTEIRELKLAGHFEEGLMATHAAVGLYGQELELVELQNELTQQLEALRRVEGRQAMIGQIRSLLSQRQVHEAERLVPLAIAEYGPDSELLDLLAETDKVMAKALQDEEIEHSMARALALAEARQFAQAHAVLDQATGSYPNHEPLLLLREDIWARQARFELHARARQQYVSGDFQQALQTVELGLEQTPDDAEWLGLKAQIELDLQKQLRAEAIHKAITAVEALLQENRFQEGEAVLAEAVLQWGQSKEAAALHDRLQGHIEAQRRIETSKRDLEELSAIQQRLSFETSKRELNALDSQAGRIAAAHAQDEDFQRLALEIRARIQSLKPAPKPIPWKPMAAIGGAVVLLGVSIFFVLTRSPRPAPASIAVKIQTDPAGGAVQVGNQSCATPTCTFQLPPGEYQIHASLPGYRDVQQTLKLATGQPPPSVSLALDPVLPSASSPIGTAKMGTLTVRTGVPKALVTVDGVPRGRTDQQGSFTVSLEAAAHSVQVGKAGYETLPAAQVRVAAGSAETIPLNMTVQSATLELRGAPAGVIIRVNNQLAGTTQGDVFSVPVNPGGQTIEIAQGGATRQVLRNFDPGQTLTVNWADILPASAAVAPKQSSVQPPVPASEEQDWDRVRSASNRADLSAFLNSHPGSAHAAEANARLDDLNWSAVNRADAPSLQAFLHQSPASGHASEAQTLLDELQQPKLPAQPKAEQPKPQQSGIEQPKPEATPSLPQPGADTQAIRAALTQFNTAFQEKQPRELKRIWPSLPDETAKAMRLAGTSYLMMLRPLRDPQIANGGAAVLCELTTTITLRGQTTNKQRQVQVLLQNNGGSWSIVNPFGPVP